MKTGKFIAGIIAAFFGLFFLTSYQRVYAQVNGVTDNTKDVKTDKADINQDKKDISQDRRDIQEDRQNICQDCQDRKDLTSDYKDIHQDRVNLANDQRDLNKDRKDLSTDRKNYRKGQMTNITSPPGYKLVWQDEFNNSMLNRVEWRILLGRHPSAESCQIKDNVYVKMGNLVIRSQKQPYTCKNMYRPGTYDSQYTSGFVITNKSWLYGYFEIRAKLPYGKGMWPAFWLRSVSERKEIDMFEVLGDNPNKLHMTYHYPTIEPTNIDCNVHYPETIDSTKPAPFVGPDYSKDYHVFATEWTPDYISFIVDGIERYKITKEEVHMPVCPMRIYLDTFVGGRWPGSPDSTTRFPQYFDIDYVRVYQK